MQAREIIRQAYGESRNFMTPHRIKIVSLLRGKVAAELSYGEGFAREPIYGISVAYAPDWNPDNVSRAHEVSRCVRSYAAMLDYVEELKEQLEKSGVALFEEEE